MEKSNYLILASVLAFSSMSMGNEKFEIKGLPNSSKIEIKELPDRLTVAEVEGWGTFVIGVVGIAPKTVRGYNSTGDDLQIAIYRGDTNEPTGHVIGRVIETNFMTIHEEYSFTGTIVK